jgi:CheY-like chemotaxis protein
MTTKRILVVDDEDTVREIVALCLQRLGGWEALTTASGQEALHQAQANSPDAIVLDVMMPEMDGFTFLQYLRADGALRSIPVILLTGKSHLPDRQRFPELGIVLTVIKPFSPLEFIQAIAQVLGWPRKELLR